MAKETILKDLDTGDVLYPHTLASLVRTSDGGNVDEALDTACIKFLAERWDRGCTVGNRQYGRYDPAAAPDPQHPFMLNELWFSAMEAADILELRPLSFLQGNHTDGMKYRFAHLRKYRTYIPMRYYAVNARVGSADGMFNEWVGGKLEVVVFAASNWTETPFTSCGHMFSCCQELRRVENLFIDLVSDKSGTKEMFNNCVKLEHLTLSGLKCDISFAHSPLLSLESFSYLIQHAANTAPITITVHPDVYAKLTDADNAQWSAVLDAAIAKDISFATV